jgi:hypothetical protein
MRVRARRDPAGLTHGRLAIVRVDELDERPGAQLRVGESERARERGIEPREIAVEAARHRDRATGRRTDPVLFGAAPLHELADLAADGVEHREEIRFQFANLAAEELHDAENVGAEHDRNPKPACSPASAAAAARGKFGRCARRR